ncbi:hypothetical protein BRCON_0653 [Candidatus Sumerlaea chitinivorans]|uniref:Uncharacterized protein n=1 Tax=Sumerlaea chitinivorans TaxID=2250252 RepID=A0A2Z4Y2V8_SUMC1|nr:hypothetical protein BRCON_0653 [Candidatus Sumerlaea chitinivorans]
MVSDAREHNIHSQFLGKLPRLVDALGPMPKPLNFLNRDNIGVLMSDDLSDSIEIHFPVCAATMMYIVRQDA